MNMCKFVLVASVAVVLFSLSACSQQELVKSPSANKDSVMAVDASCEISPQDIYIAKYKFDKAGAFSMTCDDGFRQEVEDTLEIIEPLGIRATFFIMPLAMENTERAANMITWPRVKEVHAAGHEIGTHGTIAEKLHEATDERLDYLVNESFRLIGQKAGIRSVSYACPGGSRADERVKEVIFQNHCVLRSERGDIPEIKTIGYGNTDRRHWEDLKTRQRISDNVDNGLWSVAIVHSIQGGWSPFKSKDEFRIHCQWLASQSDRIWIAPMGEVGMYLKSARISKVKTEAIGGNSIKMKLECDDSKTEIFRDVALTVVLPAVNVKEASARTADGRELETKITDGKILVNADANTGEFTVSWK